MTSASAADSQTRRPNPHFTDAGGRPTQEGGPGLWGRALWEPWGDRGRPGLCARPQLGGAARQDGSTARPGPRLHQPEARLSAPEAGLSVKSRGTRLASGSPTREGSIPTPP